MIKEFIHDILVEDATIKAKIYEKELQEIEKKYNGVGLKDLAKE